VHAIKNALIRLNFLIVCFLLDFFWIIFVLAALPQPLFNKRFSSCLPLLAGTSGRGLVSCLCNPSASFSKAVPLRYYLFACLHNAIYFGIMSTTLFMLHQKANIFKPKFFPLLE
jgi:hypothetical protein